MKSARLPLFAFGPKAKFTVRKEPFGLILRYLRTGYVLRTYRSIVLSPFGLSLSTSSAWPFDTSGRTGGGAHKGRGERTFVNSRNGPKGEGRFHALPVAPGVAERLT
jgi:hypothetical protein